MRRYTRISFSFLFGMALLLAAHALQSQTVSFDDPIDYNDYIVDQQNAIGEEVLVFNDIMGDPNSNPKQIRDSYQAVLDRVNNSIEKLNHLKPFESGMEFKLAAMELFRFYKSAFEIEYARIMEIVILGEFTQADLDEVDKLIGDVGEKEVTVDRRYTVAQEGFAKKHRFDLGDNKFEQKADSLSKGE